MLNEEKFFSAIIVAAGDSSRMNQKIRKPFLQLNSSPIILYSLNIFQDVPIVREIIVVAKYDDQKIVFNIAKKFNITKLKSVVIGGETRQDSVFLGIEAASSQATNFIIHDAARPLISKNAIQKALKLSEIHDAIALCSCVKDTVKQADNCGFVKKTIDRKQLFNVQTPQIFEKNLYLWAVKNANKKTYTDDCQLIENIKEKVFLFETEDANFKITTPDDLVLAEAILNKRSATNEIYTMKIGHGYDLHRLTKARKLIIGGVVIPYNKGLQGHSDADVLVHAIIDALLGAVCMGDIGKMFSDNDPEFLNTDSIKFLQQVCEKIRIKGHKIQNIDCTVIAQEPKISPYTDKMRLIIGEACGISKNLISVKATTEENCGPTGRGEAISAHAVCLVK
ncbi:MAG: 2-C-methyl-D-erythritol 4-phosphate cytidylyltransferase [Oscillospiraceae bacterium]|jgi:2-C-methyl-D-erythritol 4-phosphate cytidylyltransferase/2-C-methyl-D-erythritol 2,4-cyclodiphosphate synthase|nr:2-C-methyl-D-erythritol 4-phosphate cytidylyltransferase [Oscillospiraceae bacterium]